MRELSSCGSLLTRMQGQTIFTHARLNTHVTPALNMLQAKPRRVGLGQCQRHCMDAGPAVTVCSTAHWCMGQAHFQSLAGADNKAR
jgi:hypothetical protein